MQLYFFFFFFYNGDLRLRGVHSLGGREKKKMIRYYYQQIKVIMPNKNFICLVNCNNAISEK